MMATFWRLIVMIIIVGFLSVQPQAAFTQNPTIVVGRAATGTLGPTDVQSWEFVALSDGELTAFVHQLDGDLDPRLTVYNADGDPIGENDDAISGVITDAAATFMVNAGQTYAVSVQSFAGSGSYQLMVLPTDYRMVWDSDDFADSTTRWAGPYTQQIGGQLVYETGRLIDRSIVLRPTGELPITDAYLQAEFAWRTSEPSTTFGVVLRTADDAFTPDGYYFNLTPTGEWVIIRQQFAQDTILAEGQLDPAPVNPTIGAAANGSELQLFVDGALIETVSDPTFNAGGWGFHLRGNGAAAGVDIERIVITTPLSQPPTVPANISTWRSARPDDIALELTEANTIPANGRRVYTVQETSYQITPQNTRTYPQIPDEAAYAEMLLNVDVLPTAGGDVACGVSLRDIGEGDRVVVYAGSNDDAGMIVVRNGVVLSHTYDLLDSPSEPLSDGSTRLTIIIRGPYVISYVNGAYFATQYSPPVAGSVGVTLLNYGGDEGRCQFRNLWIWQ